MLILKRGLVKILSEISFKLVCCYSKNNKFLKILKKLNEYICSAIIRSMNMITILLHHEIFRYMKLHTFLYILHGSTYFNLRILWTYGNYSEMWISMWIISGKKFQMKRVGYFNYLLDEKD